MCRPPGITLSPSGKRRRKGAAPSSQSQDSGGSPKESSICSPVRWRPPWPCGRSGSAPIPDRTLKRAPTGAIKELATFPGGRVLLLTLAAGLVFDAAWRLYTARAPGQTDAESMAKRIGYLVSAALYLSFGLTAVGLARSPSNRVDGDEKARELSSGFLASTGGRWVLAVFGVAAIGTGVYRLMKGARGDVWSRAV